MSCAGDHIPLACADVLLGASGLPARRGARRAPCVTNSGMADARGERPTPRRPAFFSPVSMDAQAGAASLDPAQVTEVAHETAAVIVRTGRAAREPGADRAGWSPWSTSWGSRRWPSCGPTGPRAACPARCGGSTPCASGSAATRSGPAPTTRPGSGSPTSPTWSPASPSRRGRPRCRQLTDAILTGVFDGDLAIALERAAAFCRVVASGRAHRADDSDARASTTRCGRRPDPARRLDADHRRGPGGLRPAVAQGRPALSGRICGRQRACLRNSSGARGYSSGASGRGSPGSQIKPLRAATCREALPARRADCSLPGQPPRAGRSRCAVRDVRPADASRRRAPRSCRAWTCPQPSAATVRPDGPVRRPAQPRPASLRERRPGRSSRTRGIPHG